MCCVSRKLPGDDETYKHAADPFAALLARVCAGFGRPPGNDWQSRFFWRRTQMESGITITAMDMEG